MNDGPSSAGAIMAKNPASPSLAIGLTFVAMFATICGASFPLLYGFCADQFGKQRPILVSSQQDAAPPIRTLLSTRFTASAYAFAAGALIFGSLFDILPGSISSFSEVDAIGAKLASLAAMASLVSGVVLFILLEILLVWMAPEMSCPCHSLKHSCECGDKLSCGCVEAAAAKKVKSTSWLTFLAMTIHHVSHTNKIPEGIAFYLTATADMNSGAIVGLILLVHVFPEGISVGTPALLAYPDQPWRAVLYGAIAGFAQPVGALIAYGFFNGTMPNNAALGFISGCIAGMLLVISVRGLLSYARSIDSNDKVTSLSAFGGAMLIFFSIAMFKLAGFSA